MVYSQKHGDAGYSGYNIIVKSGINNNFLTL